MREIKFRGKSEDNSEWFYGFLQKYQEKHASRLCICAVSVRTWKDALLYSVRPDTVGQFTGLLDKNGKEIYEGDIIGCHNPDIKHLIFYNEKQGRFMAALNGDIENDFVGVCGLDDSRWNASKEVIGNVYDNPEYLKMLKRNGTND